jgi:hypothetical protein
MRKLLGLYPWPNQRLRMRMKMMLFDLYPWPNQKLSERHESHIFLNVTMLLLLSSFLRWLFAMMCTYQERSVGAERRVCRMDFALESLFWSMEWPPIYRAWALRVASRCSNLHDVERTWARGRLLKCGASWSNFLFSFVSWVFEFLEWSGQHTLGFGLRKDR